MGGQPHCQVATATGRVQVRTPSREALVLTPIRFPTTEEEELLRRFTVNLHYVEHLRNWLEATYGVGDDMYLGLSAALAARPAYQRTQRRRADTEAIRQDLSIAWMSEVQLVLPAVMADAGYMRYSNAWAPVHAYYSVYLGLQAWFEANAIHGVADDHSATLRTISRQIRDRQLFPEPWSLLATGCPMRKERVYLNVPPGAEPEGDLEVLGAPRLESFWPRYGTWLRSTREARLVARETDWKKRHGRAKIAPSERTRLASTVWATSFFDCLWRMRVRSNYRTVEPYLVRFVSDSQAESFSQSLGVVVGATLSLLELYVARAIGGTEFATIASRFLAADERGFSATTLGRRMTAYGTALPFAVRV